MVISFSFYLILFVAEASGIPYLQPYLALSENQSVPYGLNFAVAGATALDFDFFVKKNLGQALTTKDSLTVQINWFKKIKSSLCATKRGNTVFFLHEAN